LSTSNKDYDDDDNEDRKHTVSADLIDLFHYGFAQCSLAELDRDFGHSKLRA